jgi:ADP-heptose:LPS heptosyltransferase
MALGGYPWEIGKCGELYISPEERQAALKLLKDYGVSLTEHQIVLWGLNGSSFHKVYPFAELAIDDLCAANPNLRVLLMGNHTAKEMQFDHPQVIKLAGVISLRMMFALIELAKVVVGPESALVNSAACFEKVGKVVFLSHSTAFNLTNYWSNCIALSPNVACHPCHQLHHNLDSCPLVDVKTPTGTMIAQVPICTVGIEIADVVAAVNSLLKT